MLVLSRKNDQAVVIGGLGRLENTIKVTVLEIRGGWVRLAFEANKDITVHREEVWERISAGHAREPPTRQFRPTQSSGADGSAFVLSGTGKGRSPQLSEKRV